MHSVATRPDRAVHSVATEPICEIRSVRQPPPTTAFSTIPCVLRAWQPSTVSLTGAHSYAHTAGSRSNHAAGTRSSHTAGSRSNHTVLIQQSYSSQPHAAGSLRQSASRSSQPEAASYSSQPEAAVSLRQPDDLGKCERRGIPAIRPSNVRTAISNH